MPDLPDDHGPAAGPGSVPEGEFPHWDQKPALGRRGMVLAVVIPLLIAAAGFGVVSLVAHDSPTQATAVRVPTSDWIPGQPGGREPIRGELAVDRRHCLYLTTATGQEIWPVWPAGYYARLDEAGHASLYDGSDRLVARDGESVQATGVASSAAAFTGEACLPDDGKIAVVQSQVERVG